jgi:hypothetical protein
MEVRIYSAKGSLRWVHVCCSFYCFVVIETLTDEMNDMYSEAILTTDASSALVRLFVNSLF